MKAIPEPILINTGDQEDSGIQKTIDRFFLETSRYWLNQDSLRIKEGLEIKVGDHIYSGTTSENRTTYLFYREEEILATVLETRTESNKIKYTFFRNI